LQSSVTTDLQQDGRFYSTWLNNFISECKSERIIKSLLHIC